MNYNKTLTDYADGNLPVGKEEQLFGELSKNPSLRAEMKQYMFMDKSVGASVAESVPPAASSAGLFTRLGFNYAAPAAVGFLGAVRLFGTRFRQGILSGAIAMLFTTAGFLFFYNPAESEVSGDLQTAGSQGQVVVNNTNIIEPTQAGTPVVSSFADNSKTSANAQAPARLASSNQGYAAAQANTNTINNNNSNIVTSDDANIINNNIKVLDYNINVIDTRGTDSHIVLAESNNTVGFSPSNFMLSQSGSMPQMINLPNDRPSFIMGDLEDITGLLWQLEYRGTLFNSAEVDANRDNISSKDASLISGNSIAIYCGLNDNWFVGVDVKQEKFYMTFASTDGSSEFEFKSHPDITNFYLNGRYIINPYSNLRLFSQAGIGFSSYGYTPNINVGLIYSMNQNFGLLGSFGLSNLFYNHMGIGHGVLKLGFDFGVTYRL
jgi:hypothetical protein